MAIAVPENILHKCTCGEPAAVFMAEVFLCSACITWYVRLVSMSAPCSTFAVDVRGKFV